METIRLIVEVCAIVGAAVWAVGRLSARLSVLGDRVAQLDRRLGHVEEALIRYIVQGKGKKSA